MKYVAIMVAALASCVAQPVMADARDAEATRICMNAVRYNTPGEELLASYQMLYQDDKKAIDAIVRCASYIKTVAETMRRENEQQRRDAGGE